jgi:hypothetical protein
MAYEGRTEGSIVFDSAYEGDASEDLEKACWAVRTEDALCAYCVENISYEFNKIVTINEADIKISYSKASANPKQIVHLGFSSEAENAILGAMQKGSRTLALLVGRSGFSAEDMAAQVVKAYRDNPTVVPKEPQALVNVFSGDGSQRLYEIQIDYGVTALELARCRKQLELFRPFAALDRPNASEVERAYVALLEGILHDHQVIGISEHASDNAATEILRLHVIIKTVSVILHTSSPLHSTCGLYSAV